MGNCRFSFVLIFVGCRYRSGNGSAFTAHVRACEYRKSEGIETKPKQNEQRTEEKRKTNVHICSSPNKTDFGLVKRQQYACNATTIHTKKNRLTNSNNFSINLAVSLSLFS